MKNEHERWIDGQEMIPKFPEITILTRSGLRLHANLNTIAQEDLQRLREQQMIISNGNRVPLHNVKLALFFPEEVGATGPCSWNPGTHLTLRPAHEGWTVDSVAETNTVAAAKEVPTTNHLLAISQIPPGECVDLSFYTANPVEVRIFDTPEGPWRPAPDPDTAFPENHLMFFLEGSYQFVLRGEYVTVEILLPLKYKFKDRVIASLPVQVSREPWNVSPMIRFPGVELRG